MKNISRILLFACILSGISDVVMAQLTAVGANTVRYTDYGSSEVKDPVFVFCNSSGDVKGTLKAGLPSGSVHADFSWYKWNRETMSFDIALKSEKGVVGSTLTEADEGGYRVVLSNGVDTSFTGWVFLDRPWSKASLRNPMKNCYYVALKGLAAADTFYYYNPVNGNPVKLPNEVAFKWSSSPASIIPTPDAEINPVTNTPPLEDVTYSLTVVDSMGCSSKSSFFYESIHVDAAFTADITEGESPLEVNFTNESVRGNTFLWDFGDGSDPSFLEIPETHTFYLQDTVKQYTVVLTVESVNGCIDSKSTVIRLTPSSLKVPNVFSPNEDGYNDRFVLSKSSLRFLNIEIFSRSGIKVYSFNGNSDKIKDWEGWDGTVNNSSRKASPGIYFYVIRAKGWDDVGYDGKEYRGTLYLYR